MTYDATICEHVDLPLTALMVNGPQAKGTVLVKCPCCGLHGHRELADTEPMLCPYCAVEAVQITLDPVSGGNT